MPDLWLFYNGTVLFALLGLLALLGLNMIVFPSLRRRPRTGSSPFVSVLVPARNEETRIKPCVTSLQQQEYPNFEVLVLNDHSEDATEQVLRAAAFDEAAPR